MNVIEYEVKTKWCNYLAENVRFVECESLDHLGDSKCLHAGECQGIRCRWVDGSRQDHLAHVENEFEC